MMLSGKTKKNSKLRIVYDASAGADGPSLNDCLCTGPKFGQNIMDIVLRFRVHNISLTADIEKAFLIISVSETDRDVLRFLWVDDVTEEEPRVITLRYMCGFRYIFKPIPPKCHSTHHIQKYSSSYLEVVQKIIHSIYYADDIISGADTDDHAYWLYSDSKMMFKEGGFNLRKLVTNSSDLQKKIVENERLMQLPPTDHTLNDEESYAKLTLGTIQKVPTGEIKF